MGKREGEEGASSDLIDITKINEGGDEKQEIMM